MVMAGDCLHICASLFKGSHTDRRLFLSGDPLSSWSMAFSCSTIRYSVV